MFGWRSRIISVKRWDAIWLVIASLAIAWVFHRNDVLMSRGFDGVTLHSIDDDMMISMTYGRNLAEGHGLIWTRGGPHVEGYTNFLWTIVMAAVHKLGAPDATAASWMRAVGWACLVGALIQSVRVLRVFVPRSLVVTPVFLAAACSNNDIVTWAVWGFETTLLSFVFMTWVASVLRNPMSVVGWISLALVPLTRSDGVQTFLVCSIIGFLLVNADDRKRVALTRILPAALPTLAHWSLREDLLAGLHPSFSCSRGCTPFGSALPALFFITCPTKKPMSFVSPPR